MQYLVCGAHKALFDLAIKGSWSTVGHNLYIFVEPQSSLLHAKFQDHHTSGSGEEDFKGFYHLWAQQPSWSCDLDHLQKKTPLVPTFHGGYLLAKGFRTF